MVIVVASTALVTWCGVSLGVGVLAGRTIKSTERTLASGDALVPSPRTAAPIYVSEPAG